MPEEAVAVVPLSQLFIELLFNRRCRLRMRTLEIIRLTFICQHSLIHFGHYH
jgi:hypothetical protein